MGLLLVMSVSKKAAQMHLFASRRFHSFCLVLILALLKHPSSKNPFSNRKFFRKSQFSVSQFSVERFVQIILKGFQNPRVSAVI